MSQSSTRARQLILRNGPATEAALADEMEAHQCASTVSYCAFEPGDGVNKAAAMAGLASG